MKKICFVLAIALIFCTLAASVSYAVELRRPCAECGGVVAMYTERIQQGHTLKKSCPSCNYKPDPDDDFGIPKYYETTYYKCRDCGEQTEVSRTSYYECPKCGKRFPL